MCAQAALPYKSKPKQEAARKRKSLEARRAVVLEPGERRAASLVAQLNALRNARADKRRAKQARQREARAPHCRTSPAKPMRSLCLLLGGAGACYYGDWLIHVQGARPCVGTACKLSLEHGD